MSAELKWAREKAQSVLDKADGREELLSDTGADLVRMCRAFLSSQAPSSDVREKERAVIQEAKDTLKDLLMGFVRCQRCGDQEDLRTLDCVKPLSDAIVALAASQESEDGKEKRK